MVVRSVGAVDIVELPARLDAACAPELRAAIADLLARQRRQLVLDLGRVTFCDSSGVSVLLTAQRGAQDAGGAAVLLRLTPAASRVIQLTRLHHAFRIFDDEAAAVAALS